MFSIFGGGKVAKKTVEARLERDELAAEVQRLQEEEIKEDRKLSKLESEHAAEMRSAAGGLELQQLQLESSEAASELEEEKRQARRMVRALYSWQKEAQLMATAMQPRRPQLLVEVWITGGRTSTGGTGSAYTGSGVRLLGEQWIPYEAARGTGDRGVDWELLLVPRLCLSRNATEKLAPWPPLPDVQNAQAVAPPDPGASQWRVRLRIAHAATEPPWSSTEAPVEKFVFQVLSLSSTQPSAADTSGGRAPATSVQIWRWGGSNTLAPSQLGPPSAAAASIHAASAGHLVSDPWACLFKSKPTVLASGGASFDREPSFTLTLLLSPSLGGGFGILQPFDDSSDPELLAMSKEAERHEIACEEHAARVAELKSHSAAMAGSDHQKLQEERAKEVEALEAEEASMLYSVEGLRSEYEEAEQKAAALKGRSCVAGPDSYRTLEQSSSQPWGLAQRSGPPHVPPLQLGQPQPLRHGSAVSPIVASLNMPPQKVAQQASGVHSYSPRDFAPESRSPMMSARNSGTCVFEDQVLQVLGSYEHAVPDGLGRLRAQVELRLSLWKPASRFKSVKIECSSPEAGALEVQQLPVGSREESHVVTRQFNVVFLGALFTEPPVATLQCDLTDDLGHTSQEHRCEFPLPIDITAFLNPLPVAKVKDAWDRARCSVRWPVPEEVRRGLGSGPDSDKHIERAVSCGGALGRRGQSGDLVFMAELPKSRLVCIVAVSTLAGAATEVVVRSEDENLAEALLQVVSSRMMALAVPLERPRAAASVVHYDVSRSGGPARLDKRVVESL